MLKVYEFSLLSDNYVTGIAIVIAYSEQRAVQLYRARKGRGYVVCLNLEKAMRYRRRFGNKAKETWYIESISIADEERVVADLEVAV